MNCSTYYMDCERISEVDMYTCIDSTDFVSLDYKDWTDEQKAELSGVWNDNCIPQCNTTDCRMGFCFFLHNDSSKYECTSCNVGFIYFEK